MGRRKKVGYSDRASFIINLFREMPGRRFTLKQLASASGGADRDGRNAVKAILDSLVADGYITCEGRGRYLLSRRDMQHYEGTVDMPAASPPMALKYRYSA